MVAPGPRNHLHTNWQAGAGTLGLTRDLIDDVAACAAVAFLAGAHARDRYDAGGKSANIDESHIGAWHRHQLGCAVTDGRQRVSGAKNRINRTAFGAFERSEHGALEFRYRRD